MEEIAQVYARALFDAALEQDDLDGVREQLTTFAEAVDGSRDLQVFLFSPYFSTEEKKEGLGRAIEGASEGFVNFLELLVENHRMPAIFRIRRRFDQLWEEENRLLRVENDFLKKPRPSSPGRRSSRALRADRGGEGQLHNHLDV